jgi:heat shock protein HslJ
MNVRCIGTLIVVSSLLMSCSGTSLTGPSETGITRITWKLRSIQQFGNARVQIQNPDRFTVLFAEDRRVSVRADCNTCTGKFELSGSSLRLSTLACTRAFCGADSPDTQFLNALERVTTASVDREILTIASPDTVLIFER